MCKTTLLKTMIVVFMISAVSCCTSFQSANTVPPIVLTETPSETPTLTQLPTETPTPEATATITVTPTPEATATPTETATPEQAGYVITLPSGMKIVSPESMEDLAPTFARTGLKPANPNWKHPTPAVEALIDQYTKDANEKKQIISLTKLLGAPSKDEKWSGRTELLVEYGDGTYAWGLILSKTSKATSVSNTRAVLFYKSVDGNYHQKLVQISPDTYLYLKP